MLSLWLLFYYHYNNVIVVIIIIITNLMLLLLSLLLLITGYASMLVLSLSVYPCTLLQNYIIKKKQ